MTEKEKNLLIGDLCARLPYEVKFMCNKNIYTAKGLDLIVTDESDWEYAVTTKEIAPIEIDFIKPYLFPLSSMTEEQKKKWFYTLSSDYHITYDTVDWCNKNHFDYRGLIEKSLALDATGLNIYN